MARKRVYAIPTMHCNLDCNHCFIKNTPEYYNRDKFIRQLNEFEGEVILFGGEVTIYQDRMFDVIESIENENSKSKIITVSTNLTILSDRLIEFYKRLGSISTSWNFNRFNDNQYQLWKDNCRKISDNGIKYKIMITLTNDLFTLNAKEFLAIAKEWVTPNLKEIKFEHYIGDEVTPEYFDKADEWLCDLYTEWNLEVPLGIINTLDCWNFNCDDVYTLYPDGTLINSCPHAKNAIIASECYTCDKVSKCRPCRLQPYCSYPHKLAKLVKGEIKYEKTNSSNKE